MKSRPIEVKCEYCAMLLNKIKEKESPYKEMTEYELNITKNSLQETMDMPVGFCRGFLLCTRHMDTIKQDNKYRIHRLNGEIPNTLEVKKPSRSSLQ